MTDQYDGQPREEQGTAGASPAPADESATSPRPDGQAPSAAGAAGTPGRGETAGPPYVADDQGDAGPDAAAGAPAANGAGDPASGPSQPEADEAAYGNTDQLDLAAVVAERTADLQRLQAEYVNYKRRVDRDRDIARQRGVEAVLADLLPALDGIGGARAHDELSGGAKMIADEIEKVVGKYGLEVYGQPGDPFDPQIHEALMHVDQPGYDVATCAQVIQPGYRLGDRVVRPARVAVAEPSDPQ